MNNLHAICAATSLLFYAGALHAQDVVAVPAGTDQILPMRKGEPAPFDGQIFDNATALRWGNWLVQYKNLVKNNKELDQKICQADVDLQQKKIDLMTSEYNRVTQELQAKLSTAQAEAASPPWYRTVTFGVALGVVGTIAAVVGTAAIVNATK